MMFSGSSMVHVWTGGMKNQLTSSVEATAATPTTKPPSTRMTTSEEEQQEVGRERKLVAEGGEDHGQQRQPDDDERARRRCGAASGGRRLRRSSRRATRWSLLVVSPAAAPRDHVHVEAVRLAARSFDDRAVEQLVPPSAAAGAEDELRGLLASGEVDQRLWHSFADDLAVAAAQLLDEAVCRSAPGRPAQAVGGTTCTPMSAPRSVRRCGPPAARAGSPPGAPVMATTTRSRVSHVSAMPWASM